MNIYFLSQSDNRGYDTYDSCVVYAESDDAARLITPSEFAEFGGGMWASCPENVNVLYLGVATLSMRAGIILASFNAG
jgi:hypothetical protein